MRAQFLPVDSDNAALMRLLSLSEESHLQQNLETLISTAEEHSFEAVAGELAAYVDDTLQRYSPHHAVFDDRMKKALVRSMYDAIQFYKPVPSRKVGGKYFQHPVLLFHILLQAGCTDLATFLDAFDHDIPEELLKIARGKGDRRPDSVIIAEIIDRISERRYASLREVGFSHHQAQRIQKTTAQEIHNLTKQDVDLYYGYVGRIFTPLPETMSRISQLRCMRVKYADSTANLLNLASLLTALSQNTWVTDRMIIADYQDPDFSLPDPENEGDLYSLIRGPLPKNIRKDLLGSAKMKAIYKAIIVCDAERKWVLAGNRRDPVIRRIALPETISNAAQEVINYLCTWRSGNYPGDVPPSLIYQIHQEHQQYARSGGYNGVSPPGSYPLWGLLGRFDTSVRGKSQYIRSLDRDSPMMMRAAVAFRHLGRLYLRDKTYSLPGLTSAGLVHAQNALS